MIYDSWFDSQYGLAPEGMNQGLFTAYYCRMVALLNRPELQLTKEEVEVLIKYNLTSPPFTISNDNMTGMLSLSKQFDLGYENTTWYPQWFKPAYRLHPRDIWFYNYLRGGLWQLVVLPFFIVFVVDGFLTMMDTSKAADGSLNTSGKLLHWLRAQTLIANGSILAKPWFEILTWILLKRSGLGWAGIFKIYFTATIADSSAPTGWRKDTSHPLIELASQLYKE